MTKISPSTIGRLSHYYRVLLEVEAEGRRTISSRRLAEREGITSAQVRKDLSCFGAFGRRGLGYDVTRLSREIRGILGLDRRWRVALVGAGHIGSALLAYQGFSARGFDIVAVFDRSPERVGTSVGGLKVRDISRLGAAEAADGFDLGVIAVPIQAAQEVCDLLVAAGVRGVLNFAPRKVFVPAGVTLRAVDLAVEFESISFALTRVRSAGRRRPRAAL
jgi:redox-sensing transcriptional repressor